MDLLDEGKREGGEWNGCCKGSKGELWWRLKWILLRQADDALDDKKLGIFQQHWHIAYNRLNLSSLADFYFFSLLISGF